VTVCATHPARSSAARDACASFGRVPLKSAHPANERAQYRARASGLDVNCCTVIGRKFVAYAPIEGER